MVRPAFLVVAAPALLGAFGHAYLGERDIFPKITVASTGLLSDSIRVLRLSWHAVSLTFFCFGVALTALGLKRGVLSNSERWVVTGISIWFAIQGIAGVGYWTSTKPQPYLFLLQSALLQGGLRWTP